MNLRLRVATATALITLPTALLAAGCDSESSPPEPARTTAASASTSAAATTKPAPAVTPSKPVPFTAANGRNLQACADGKCEVFVQTGDSVPNVSGSGPVQISVGAGEVTISTTSASGFVVTMTGRPGNTEQLNSQVFLVLAVRGGRAVLRLFTQ